MKTAAAQKVKKTFDALGDSNRLRILKLLSGERELCVCDIFEALDLPQNLTSYHLNVLREAGIVSSRREGVRVIYKINGEKVSEFKKTINGILK